MARSRVSGASAGALSADAGLGHASISAVAAIPAVLISILFVIMELLFVPLFPVLLYKAIYVPDRSDEVIISGFGALAGVVFLPLLV